MPCSNLISNCTQCTADNDLGTTITCSVCSSITFLVLNKCISCQELIPSCDGCSNTTRTCDNCTVGTYRKDNGNSCAQCTGLIPNCTQCSANDALGTNITCSQCAPDSYLVGNRCISCSQLIISCTTCNVNYSCDVCSNGHFRNDSGRSCPLCNSLINNCN